MRRIHHPGPVVEPNVQFLPTRSQTVHVKIDAGQSLLASFAGLLAHYGCQSAVARLGQAEIFPAVYVMPALSVSPEHAVYYSDRHFPVGPIQIDGGAVTVGMRDGQPWIHCHASWQESDGTHHCGHLLPEESILACPMSVELTLLLDAGFEVCVDEHTHFSLFKPRPMAGVERDTNQADFQRGWCMRVAPNVDLCQALESFCSELADTPLKVLGGVGSTVGAVFDDGRVVEPFVTELLVESGQVLKRDGQWLAELDVGLVDYMGGVHKGRLARGENPVLVTCELVLVSC